MSNICVEDALPFFSLLMKEIYRVVKVQLKNDRDKANIYFVFIILLKILFHLLQKKYKSTLHVIKKN
jgi:hypothetical protein